MRRCSTLALFATVLLAPLSALAQASPNCPPGAWFCEETPVERAPNAAPERPKAPPPDADDEPGEPRAAEPRQPVTRPPAHAPGTAPAGRPPVVIYQPVPTAPPAHVVIVAPGLARPVPPPPPPPPPPRPISRSEWGINMRVEGIALGRASSSSSGMGGLGLSLRYRPVPAFALDLGADVVGGIDYNGMQRLETPLSLSGLVYVNPRSKVQFYLTGGADWSHARVRSDEWQPMMTYRSTYDGTTYRADTTTLSDGYKADYYYLGGHGGVGLEFRLSRHVALDLDTIGFVRTRVDRKASSEPEFVSSTGQTTNTSGGGLFRFGLTIWW
jgi:hypothetical protein